jgi:hypothetical protein
MIGQRSLPPTVFWSLIVVLAVALVATAHYVPLWSGHYPPSCFDYEKAPARLSWLAGQRPENYVTKNPETPAMQALEGACLMHNSGKSYKMYVL